MLVLLLLLLMNSVMFIVMAKQYIVYVLAPAIAPAHACMRNSPVRTGRGLPAPHVK